MTIQTNIIEGLIKSELKRAPDIVKKELEGCVNGIKTEVENILKKVKGGNIEQLVRLVVKDWIFWSIVYKNYLKYKDLIKGLGTSPLEYKDFKVGPGRDDPKGLKPWKRYQEIINQGINIGDTVYENTTGKNYEVSGITRNVMLQLKGYKGGEPQNPINFSKKKQS